MNQKIPPAIEDLRHGTQVLYLWATWQKKHAPERPVRTTVFRKGEYRLVVHQYGASLCGILKLAEIKPRVREFHEWREPFQKVHSKLVKRGWALVSDSGEVGHVAH